MGKKKTWYVSDDVEAILNEIKITNNFKNMNQVLEMLVKEYSIDSLKKLSLKNESENKKISMIDKNVSILLEMISWQCDKTGTIPEISVVNGFSNAFNSAKELVEENIERDMKLKKENLMF